MPRAFPTYSFASVLGISPTRGIGRDGTPAALDLGDMGRLPGPVSLCSMPNNRILLYPFQDAFRTVSDAHHSHCDTEQRHMANNTKAPVGYQPKRRRGVPSSWCVSWLVPVAVSASHGLAAHPTLVRDQYNVEMVRIPALTFMMGDDSSGADARPSHLVTVSPFLIDRTEVTYAQFRRFLLERPEWRKGRAQPSVADANYLLDWTGLSYPPGNDDHPVVWVSWPAAAAYAKWRGARLPTEAEWEAAARGTDGRRFPWGNSRPDTGSIRRCNYRSIPPERDGYLNTAPVGTYPDGTSPFGVVDMAGNAWEWVADWHDPDFYAESSGSDPTGPESGTYRVLRGGSWSVPASWVASTVRLRAFPVRSSDQVGFRCARTLPSRTSPSRQTD